jgi:DNA-directed RNA polymerase subunit RPC12/RpoP
MKCIQCGTDNKLKERYENQGRCKNCGHEFAFELTTATPYYLSKLTDTFFQNLIIGISVNNTFNFTSKQLFYF